MKGFKREEFFKGSSQPNVVQRLRFPPMKEKRWMSCLDGGLITSLLIRGAYGSNWSLVPNGIFKHFYYKKKISNIHQSRRNWITNPHYPSQLQQLLVYCQLVSATPPNRILSPWFGCSSAASSARGWAPLQGKGPTARRVREVAGSPFFLPCVLGLGLLIKTKSWISGLKNSNRFGSEGQKKTRLLITFPKGNWNQPGRRQSRK